MQAVTTIGLDIAKSVFQIHGVDAAGHVIVRRAQASLRLSKPNLHSTRFILGQRQFLTRITAVDRARMPIVDRKRTEFEQAFRRMTHIGRDGSFVLDQPIKGAVSRDDGHSGRNLRTSLHARGWNRAKM